MAYEDLRRKCEAKYGSINKMAKELGITAQDLYAAFAGTKPFYPKWYNAVLSAIGDAPAITVYQEIKQMDKNSLAKWILRLIHEGPDYLAEVYCRLLCEYRKTPSMCSIPEEDDCPTKNDKISDFEIIIALLDSEA